MSRRRRVVSNESRVQRVAREVFPYVKAFVLLHGDRILRSVSADARASASDLYRALRKNGIPQTVLKAVFLPSYGLSWLSGVIHVVHQRVRPSKVRDAVLEAVSCEYADRIGRLLGHFRSEEEMDRPVLSEDVERKFASLAYFPEDVPLLKEALRCGIATKAVREPVPGSIAAYLS